MFYSIAAVVVVLLDSAGGFPAFRRALPPLLATLLLSCSLPALAGPPAGPAYIGESAYPALHQLVQPAGQKFGTSGQKVAPQDMLVWSITSTYGGMSGTQGGNHDTATNQIDPHWRSSTALEQTCSRSLALVSVDALRSIGE
jgi:hypothetical protein